MDAAKAFQIVLDLAKQNVIDPRDDEEGNTEQTEAINIVEDIAVNQYGDV